MAKKKLIPRVTSLSDLRVKAESNPEYAKLAIAASNNLGGPESPTLNQALRWLSLNAGETTESGVVAEVNHVRDCI